MKIGILGGSFNPVHNMHVDIALNILDKHIVDKVIFVPTGSKYKYKNNLLPDEHRLNMLKLAVSSYDNIFVDDYELKDYVVYTIDTLNYFKNKYKDDEIYFICGTDNLSYIDQWKSGMDILSNFKIVVVDRNGNDINSLLAKYNDYKDNIIILEMNKSDISSTAIRECIFNDKDISKYIDEKVYKYILDNNLYI